MSSHHTFKLILFAFTLLWGTVISSNNSTTDSDWQSYKENFQKKYDNPTIEETRYQIWLSNVAVIAKHNEDYAAGKNTYAQGVNQFTDQTTAELNTMLPALELFDLSTNKLSNDNVLLSNSDSLPSSVNWTAQGWVTPVKNQLQCGACWAFSSTGALEGQLYNLTGNLVALSEQNLVDCSVSFGNNGCNGGNQVRAYRYIIDAGGVNTELSYPYTGNGIQTCQFKSTNIGAKISNYTILPKIESALLQAVANVGPVAVSFNSIATFASYKQGIYYDTACNRSNINHAVLCVGYGTDSSGNDYWLIKNQWGVKWGIQGYAMIARNKGDLCGLTMLAVYPIAVSSAKSKFNLYFNGYHYNILILIAVMLVVFNN